MYEILENDVTDIAIIGMTVRLPGIEDLDSFWQVIENGTDNLNSGRESVGSQSSKIIHVRNKLNGKELFDEKYFGISMQDAVLMDPQHRIFLECVNDAILHAGYTPETLKGITGVFGSTHLNTYLLNNLLPHIKSGSMVDSLQTVMSNEKDHVAAFTAYKMNFTGPAVNIQSTCSSSLAGVHLACESLHSYSCDTAVVGAATVDASLENGYRWEDNGILSRNGCCRPFDSQSTGTVYSDGAGVIILKRLADAAEDNDTIYGVIKGSAMNNDGSERVGYTAPGVKGQVEVIRRALANAGVSAENISYIEGHGTGTLLGDNIEITALKEVFDGMEKNGCCALGSLKANFGHTGPASGIIGVVKTVLALNKKILPPQVHFQIPNGALETMDHPFYINTHKTEWESKGKKRRAGVSSFGLGGSNVHIILEETPAFNSPVFTNRDWQSEQWKDTIAQEDIRRTSLPQCPYQKRITWISSQAVEVNGEELQKQIEYTILDEKQLEYYQPPNGPKEALVIDIWQEELRIKPIGAEDNYFELGGNSILAARINRRICELFRQEMSLKEFLEEQNVRNLVKLLNRKKAND